MALMSPHLKTRRAMMMREELQQIFETAFTRQNAEERIRKLLGWMTQSHIEPMKRFAKLARSHLEEILNYFDYRFTNALIEGVNSIIQNIKRRARGFKNTEYFKTMIYLVCGKFPLEKYVVRG